MSKEESFTKFGKCQVKLWTTSFDIPPPEPICTDPKPLELDSRYAHLDTNLLPKTESMKDTIERVLPFWHDEIVPSIKKGKRVLVVAHLNSIRALIKHIDNIPNDKIMDIDIPTGLISVSDHSAHWVSQLDIVPGTSEQMKKTHRKEIAMTGSSENSLYQLVLIRACESEFSGNGLLCGWADSDVSYDGECQAEEMGKYLLEKKIEFDVAFTSYLKRAIKTCHTILEQMGLHWIPVHKSWRMNARMYGILERCDKSKLAFHHGNEQIMAWTRKFAIAPPPLFRNSRDHPVFENKYELLAKSVIPDTEGLRDVHKRVLPFWCDEIVPAIKVCFAALLSTNM
ncbi:hypothetical protein ACTXT7_010960 [Hymenolepis weldensis]